jgi:prepilin-type N-terminal cleavage/methylation domain-containing protein
MHLNLDTLKLEGNQKGNTLLEVLIGLAILAVIVAAFFGAPAMGFKAYFVTKERLVAQSLAQSELEHVKRQDYDAINNPPQYTLLSDTNIPNGYVIDLTAQRLDIKNDGLSNDDGIQKITATVYHDSDPVLTIDAYKVLR